MLIINYQRAVFDLQKSLTKQYHFFVNDFDLNQESLSFTKNDIIRIEKSAPKNFSRKTAIGALAVSGAAILTVVIIVSSI